MGLRPKATAIIQQGLERSDHRWIGPRAILQGNRPFRVILPRSADHSELLANLAGQEQLGSFNSIEFRA